MVWVQIILAIITLGTELVKYLAKVHDDKGERVAKAKEMTNALKTARKTGDTSAIEKMLADLGLTGGGNGNSAGA